MPNEQQPTPTKIPISVRVGEAQKQRWERAAAARGQSLTTFLCEAADQAANIPEDEELPPALGTEDWALKFRRLLMDAKNGGKGGYYRLGRELLRTLMVSLSKRHLDELDYFTANRRRSRDLLDWLEERAPDNIAPIPRRRRLELLKGLIAEYRAAEE